MHEIEVQSGEVESLLNRLIEQGEDMTTVNRAIAAALHDQTEQNFARESGPLGPWQALKNPPERRQGGKILQDSGRLAASITESSGADFAALGTAVVYAAIQQLGGVTRPHVIEPRYKKALAFGGHVLARVNHPGSDIPARPYFPILPDGRLQPETEGNIVDLLNEYFSSGR